MQYVKSGFERPIKELKGFKRVSLRPWETKKVTFLLDKSALTFYDIETRKWIAETGLFKVLVGSSSRDIRLTTTLRLVDSVR